MKQCVLCKGKTTLKRVTAESWWGGSLALVENVPAWVCEQCGEQYFAAATAEALVLLREDGAQPIKMVQVPVYTYPEQETPEKVRNNGRKRRASPSVSEKES